MSADRRAALRAELHEQQQRLSDAARSPRGVRPTAAKLYHSPREAAVRECREETGYEVASEREVGRYLHPSVHVVGDHLTTAFRCHIVGGKPRGLGLETTALRWFEAGALPRSLESLHRAIVGDALAPTGEPVERRIEFARWKLWPARVAFALEDAVEGLLRKWTGRG